MTHRLTRTPEALAARAAAALLFGVVTLAWSTATVAAFVWLFAAFAVTDGAAAVAAALRFRRRGRDGSAARDPLFLFGAGGAGVGLIAAAWPDVTMQTLVGLVIVWAAVSGGGHLYAALRPRPRPTAWALIAGAGLAAVALAAALALLLAAGEVRVGWEIGGYALASGALLGAAAWRLRAALAAQPRRRATDAPADAGNAAADAENARYVAGAPAEA